MTTQKPSSQKHSLRRRAEEKVGADSSTPLEPVDHEHLLHIIHELRVHQVELQMQNKELRQAQEELETARSRYFDLYDQAPVGYLTLNDQGLILEVNLTAATMLGVPRKNLLHKKITGLILPEDQDQFYLHLKQPSKPDETKTIEVRMLRPGASPVWVNLQITQSASGDRRITLIDISKRRAFEDALRASELRFRTLLENVPNVAIQGYAADGTVKYWNSANEKVYGYKAEEVIGKDIVELIIPPEMRDFVRQAIRHGAETGEMPHPSELQLMRKGGSLVSVFSSHAVVKVPGKEPELFCIDLDFTELKRVEEALKASHELLRTFIEHSPIYAFIKEVSSTESRVLCASENYIELIGVSGSEMIGKTMAELFPAEFAEKISADDWSVACNREVLTTQEEFNGRTYKTIKFPIVQGDKTLLAGYTIDITELETRVKERTAELERTTKELEEFCYALSHEFRAPIARLEGFGTMLQEIAGRDEKEQIIHCADRIVAAGKRLRTVIDALLVMNRVFRADMNLQLINLSDLATHIISELLIDNSQRTINISVTPDVMAMCDRYMMEICLSNLLSNAVKYSSNKVESVIEFGQCMTNGETVYFVRDNGVGFNMNYAKDIFRPFSRLHTENEFAGTGVGLATVHRIIEKHNGRIWIEAKPGEGATFFFTLGGMGKSNE